MKFKIVGLQNEKEIFFTFDNIQNAIFDKDGKRVFYDEKLKYSPIEIFCGEHNNHHLSKNPASLSIVLGLKCNFHCEYCQQMSVRDKNLYNANPSKVDNFIKMLKESGLKPMSIQIWGGEPLVYWKTLEKLLPALRELYPDTPFGFPTNGSLLTIDKVDFLFKYGCSFFISYDGKHTYRDYPVLDDPTVDEAVKYATSNRNPNRRMISILPLQTEVSQDVMEMKKELGERYNGIQVSMHSIVRCNSDTSEWTKYARISEKRRKEIENEIFDTLNSSNSDHAMKDRFTEHIKDVYMKKNWRSMRGPCQNATGGDISVDMDGNILNCMNNPFGILGNLKEFDNVKLNCYYHPMMHKKCRECHLLHFCQATCPLIKDENTTAFEYSCENYYALNNGQFRAMFSAVFGMYVTDIIPIEETREEGLEDFYKECDRLGIDPNDLDK